MWRLFSHCMQIILWRQIETLQIEVGKICKASILRHNRHTPNANNAAKGRHHNYADHFSLKVQLMESVPDPSLMRLISIGCWLGRQIMTLQATPQFVQNWPCPHKHYSTCPQIVFCGLRDVVITVTTAAAIIKTMSSQHITKVYDCIYNVRAEMCQLVEMLLTHCIFLAPF